MSDTDPDHLEGSCCTSARRRDREASDGHSCRGQPSLWTPRPPQDPNEFLGPILEQLEQRLALLDDAVVNGSIRVDTAVHLDPMAGQDPDAQADQLRRQIFEAHPPGQFPAIILEIDSATRFSWILLGREPRSCTELLMLYSAILAHGTSLTAADISRMVPEVSTEAIRQMMKRLADERTLRAAADAVLEFMHEHPIAVHWG